MLSLKITNSNESLSFNTPIFRIYKDTITETGNLPTVVTDGGTAFINYFSYADVYAKNHTQGQTNTNDFDQYAIYYVHSYQEEFGWNYLRITNLGGVNYYSMNWEANSVAGYTNTAPNNFVTCVRLAVTQSPTPTKPPYSFTYGYDDGSDNIDNPFQPNNRATSCFDADLTQGQETNADNALRISQAADFAFDRPRDANFPIAELELGVYRPSKNNSTPFDDCFQTNQCAPTYLYIPMSTNQSFKYGMIKIKTPNVYIATECVDYTEFDVLYYSVSCILNSQGDNVNNLLLPYWTVNGRMLNGIKSADGYAYIVWAPHDEVVDRKANPQPTDIITNPYEPPIVTTKDGDYAYLLQQSDYYYNIRFQEANPNWAGNPVNARCNANDSSNQPISNELGEWCPQVYASTDTSFF